MDTLTLTAGDARVSVTLPPAADDHIDAAELKKRQDTTFKVEVVSPDGTRFSAEARARKSRSDTSFRFEIGGSPAEPDAAPDLATFDLGERVDGSILQDETFAVTARKRQDTSFRFEITPQNDPAGGTVEESAKKQRTDTNFKFEVVTSDGAVGFTDSLSVRTRKDTDFAFEVVISDPGSVLTEALVASKRKSSSVDAERMATPTGPGSEPGVCSGLTVAEIRESLGGSSLPCETLVEAKKLRHDTSFSVAVVTPGGVFVSVVVRSSESAGTDG